jgi:hypothetical protein
MTGVRLSLGAVTIGGPPEVRPLPEAHSYLGDYSVEFGSEATLYVTRAWLTALRDAATAALEVGR